MSPTQPNEARNLKELYSIPEAAHYLCRTEGHRILLEVRDMDEWIERSKALYSDDGQLKSYKEETEK